MRMVGLGMSGLLVLVAARAVRAWARQRYRYRLDGFPSAALPSPWLFLKQKLGRAQFYSQLGQDQWILGVVFRGVENGFFLDIGAADANDGSNSLALEQAGWSGICVEPFPTGDWSCRTATLVEDVLYSTPGELVEFRLAGTRGGVDTHIETWGDDVVDAPMVTRKTRTIEDVLVTQRAPRFIEYLSLDTEGSEYEILRTFPFSDYEFGAITVEHNGESAKREQIRTLLETKGYHFDREHVVEDWYVHARFVHGANRSRIHRRRQV